MPDMDTGFERRRTDSGQTGDKIAALDPAAVPVHADAEAAGTPTARGAVVTALGRIRDHLTGEFRPDSFGAVRHPESPVQRHLFRQLMIWQVGLPVALGLLAGWYGWPG